LLETTADLAIPYKTHLAVLAHANDVIHSLAIPGLGIKADCVPGRTALVHLYAAEKGFYYGQCSELCGANHAFMPISLEVVGK